MKKRKKKEISFIEKVNYDFDKVMSKGIVALIIALFLIVILATIILGLIAFIFTDETSLFKLIWDSFTNMLDPGVVSGATYNDYGYLIPMLLATLFGLFFTATLIGIVTQAISDKIYSLRNGQSRILDKNHFVIIGYNEGTWNIIAQLLFSFEGSYNKHTIVAIGDYDKVKMEEEIKDYLKTNFMDQVAREAYDNVEKYQKKMQKIIKKTTILCRTGSIGDKTVLLNCNIRNARSIIVNEFDDLSTMKALLTLNSISREQKLKVSDPYIVCAAMKKENADLFRQQNEGEWQKYVLYFADQISKITARSTLHPGVSVAFEDLFDFGGNEIYIEKPRGYENLFFKNEKNNIIEYDVTFGSILNKIRRACVMGYKREGVLYLNPPLKDRIYINDDLILLEQQQFDSYVSEEPNINVRNYNLFKEKIINESENILVLGCNSNMPQILAEANKYLEEGSTVVVACSYEQLIDGIKAMEVEKYSTDLHNLQYGILTTEMNDAHGPEYYEKVQQLFNQYIVYQNKETIDEVVNGEIKCNLTIRFKLTNIYSSDSFEVLLNKANEFLQGKLDHILVLSDMTLDQDLADEKTLFLLMNLRHRFVKNNVNITTEMRRTVNQIIAQNSSVDDFIISDKIVSNMLTQIAKNKDLYSLFDDILDVEGSEIYLEPFKNYISFNAPKEEYNFYEITKIVTSKSNRIPIGYRILGDNTKRNVVINPSKRKIFSIGPDDMVIVVAKEK